uniref:NADH dehydrogenase [ubiquinone] 1 subunit C1, mitochondrial n=1 Tax=Scophthalmus maximus TaxID=52904 RepID=A0A8D3D4Z8_SCOMX
MIFNRFVVRAALNSRVGTRSAFTSRKPDTANPNWLAVGLAFASSAFIWGLVNDQHFMQIIVIAYELYA